MKSDLFRRDTTRTMRVRSRKLGAADDMAVVLVPELSAAQSFFNRAFTTRASDARGSDFRSFDPRTLIRTLVQPSLESHTEIEVPFFSTLDLLREKIALSKLAAQHLFQAYIPEKNLAEVLRRLGTSSTHLMNIDEAMCSRARIRRVIEMHPDVRGAERFYLQLKSPKTGGVSRTELSIELPGPRFTKLLPLATAGAVEKIRYIKPGTVRSVRGKVFRAEAHIDILLGAGKDLELSHLRRAPISHADFVFIDVELPSAQLIPLLAEPHRHSFNFLSQTLPVLDQERWIRRSTATRYLAASGLSDSKFRKAVKRLTHRVNSLD